jgi:YaiO family outer membrane protein
LLALSAAAALAFAAPAADPACALDAYACAAQAYRAGDLQSARRRIDALLRAKPANADALLLSGLLWMREERLAPARDALDRAAAAAPEYADVFVARARLNLREGQIAAARRDVDRALALAPNDPDAAALRRNMLADPSPRAWTLSLDQSISRVSPRRSGAWYETLATVAHRSGATGLSLEIEHARRFGTSDVKLQLRGERGFGRASLYGGVVATADPDFREHWGLRAGGSVAASDRLDILVDGRFSDFGDVRSGSVTLAGRAWFADRRASVRAAVINFIDEAGDYRVGGAVNVSGTLDARTRVQASYARYPETESGVTRRIETAFAGIAFDLNPRLTVRSGVEREVRRGAYKRTSLLLGLSAGF